MPTKIINKFLAKKDAKVYGQALMLGGISIGWASALMSSRWSVTNFSDTPEKLAGAKAALWQYLAIGSIWAIGTSLLLGAEYENGNGIMNKGFAAGILSNLAMMAYIYWSYNGAFKEAIERHNLPVTSSVSPSWLPYPVGDSTRTYPLENRGTAGPGHSFVSNLERWTPHPYVPEDGEEESPYYNKFIAIGSYPVMRKRERYHNVR